jgi:tetratricopeptide (TPR) repeat protein
MLSAFAARADGSSPVGSEDSAQGGGASGSAREEAPWSGELAPAHAGEAFDILAMSYRGKGDLERANLFIDKALEINPRSVQYLNNSGVILAERGMIDKARVQWQEVLEIEPGNEAARQYLSIFSR